MQSIPHLSWSRLQCYEKCPREFAYRYIEQARPERICAAMPMGSAFHYAAEQVAHARLCGESLPRLDELINAYDGEWRRQMRTSSPLVFATGEDQNTLRETAYRMLQAYLRHPEDGSREVVAIEHECRWRIGPGLPRLVGRIDMVERDGSTLLISDLKTSRNAWSAAKVDESAPQLAAYAYALHQAGYLEALNLSRVEIRFVVVTKGVRPKVQDLRPAMPRKTAGMLRQAIRDVWSGVCGRRFPRRRSWRCRLCAYGDRCARDAARRHYPVRGSN
jgi:RecB family exonuclease